MRTQESLSRIEMHASYRIPASLKFRTGSKKEPVLNTQLYLGVTSLSRKCIDVDTSPPPQQSRSEVTRTKCRPTRREARLQNSSKSLPSSGPMLSSSQQFIVLWMTRGGWTPCHAEHIPLHVCSAEGAAHCAGKKHTTGPSQIKSDNFQRVPVRSTHLKL